jgi:hypothetical protein
MRKIRYRWYSLPADPPGSGPRIGRYLIAPTRPRGGYLIVGLADRGKRGGLGAEVHQLFVLDVERVSREEVLASGDYLFIVWDSRRPR